MHHYIIKIIVSLIFIAQSLDAQSILKDFEGRQVNQFSVYLEWTTRAGNTCADLSIERSFEGGGFEEVYQYNGICGETDKDQDYHHTDSISYAGRFGYRINENNGTYSDTIFIQVFFDGKDIVAYPNPAHERIYLRFAKAANAPFDYLICGIDGTILQRGYGIMPDMAIELASLNSGVYRLICYNSAGYIFNQSFLHIRD
jgi:hypothetical protein